MEMEFDLLRLYALRGLTGVLGLAFRCLEAGESRALNVSSTTAARSNAS